MFIKPGTMPVTKYNNNNNNENIEGFGNCVIII